MRDASGLMVPELIANDSWQHVVPDCAANGTCPYGLLNFFQVNVSVSFAL